MAVHRNSLKNLEKGQKFYTGDPRGSKGKARGTNNRKTRFKEWLEMETDCKDPAGNKVQLPLIDKVILAMINKAAQGNVAAANVVLDSMYGKRDEGEDDEPAKQIFDWSVYTEEETRMLVKMLERGATGPIEGMPHDELNNEQQ